MSYLPAYCFCRNPYLLVSFESDFIRNAASFKRALPENEPVTLLIQLGWQRETVEMRDKLAAELADVVKLIPNISIIVLANSLIERDNLRAVGIKSELCNHNAFLDERRIRINFRQKKEFDAIYVARITPFKRHYLAYGVKSLRMIGCYSTKSKLDCANYAEVRAHLPLADYSNSVWSSRIPHEIQRAHCGLCLSAEEGAMFVCGEYLLCGVPVVNTVNMGGRDTLIPEFAMRRVGDSADEVAAAVEWWKEHAPDPQKVRAGFLEMAEPHRELLRRLIFDITGKKIKRFPHKLGVRRRLMPWEQLFHGVRKK
ncbi:MAG: hypothetical protein PHI35_01620 [Victivallaceae bacterium]|nr:hypothetical protein [Victivallaceae bacterium]